MHAGTATRQTIRVALRRAVLALFSFTDAHCSTRASRLAPLDSRRSVAEVQAVAPPVAAVADVARFEEAPVERLEVARLPEQRVLRLEPAQRAAEHEHLLHLATQAEAAGAGPSRSQYLRGPIVIELTRTSRSCLYW